MLNLTLAKDSQAMISYKFFSHLEALEPKIREKQRSEVIFDTCKRFAGQDFP